MSINPISFASSFIETFHWLNVHYSKWRSQQRMRKHEIEYAKGMMLWGDSEEKRIASSVLGGARLVDVLPPSKY